MSSFYPGLSYKYLFMAYKNPRAAREQAIFLKRFKWQIKFVNHKTRSADEEKRVNLFSIACEFAQHISSEIGFELK